MTHCHRYLSHLAVAVTLLLSSTAGAQDDASSAGVGAEEKVVNIYSSRHYPTDEAMYERFTAETGIEINRLEASGDVLIERMKNEGRNSPADVYITVDVGRLWRAEEAGLFRPTRSVVLRDRIPANLRHPRGTWYGFSTRARVIFYNRDVIDPATLKTYEDLADPRWENQICIRSSGNIYNLSLLASLIAHHGAVEAENWARGVVANFARDPQGGDTDQIRAVASGECGIAVANTYYFARILASDDPKDIRVAEKVGIIFPNQDGRGLAGRGAHVNISGAGVVATAPHPGNAVRFLEYLAGDAAQGYLANGNNEYPVVAGLLDNPVLLEMGAFKVDDINVSVFGVNQAEAQRIFDRAGWK